MAVVVVVAYLSVCLSASSETKQFCESSSVFGTYQHQTRSNSAGFPTCFNLTTSKMKQFCETSSIVEVDIIKAKQFCEASFKNGKLSAELTCLVPMGFAIFPLHLCKVLRLPGKSDARSYEVLHLSRKNILANLKI